MNEGAGFWQIGLYALCMTSEHPWGKVGKGRQERESARIENRRL